MKRKLISYDVFESIQNDSLSAAEAELVEAQPILSSALEVEHLELLSFGPETALYEAVDGTYVHAQYKMDEKGKLKFENIEQLAIDTDSEKVKSREKIGLLVDALLETNEGKSNEEKAIAAFNDYMNLPSTRRNLKEDFQLKASASTGRGIRSKFRGKHRAGGHGAALKAARTRGRNDRRMTPGMKRKIDRLRALETKKLGGRQIQAGRGERSIRTYIRRTAGSKRMAEWTQIVENVFGYLDYKSFGPVLQESVVAHDDKNNVVALTIPTTHARNEAKLLSFNWKHLDSEVKALRTEAKAIVRDEKFAKATADLKRQNAVSDNKALEESLENMVTTWPALLYLTQDELTSVVKEALESVRATNYDDNTCAFMAEALLNTAHTVYADRVSKIIGLAGAKVNEDAEDKFAEFKNIADTFFPTLDENTDSEMKVYVDLYESLRSIYQMAEENKDELLKSGTAEHLDELVAILKHEAEPSLEVAEQAAEWLNYIVESIAKPGTWDVRTDTFVTVSGDHPDLAKNAKQSYTPSDDFTGGDDDFLKVSDGKNILSPAEREKDGWITAGQGIETYPNVTNPYIPKPFGDYTMKGEDGVDKNGKEGVLYSAGIETWPDPKSLYPTSDPTTKLDRNPNSGKLFK